VNKQFFHGDGFLETKSVQNTFPGKRKGKMFPQREILKIQNVTVESTGVSLDTSDKQTFPWIPVINGRFLGYGYAI
jgi:hypothetical protein